MLNLQLQLIYGETIYHQNSVATSLRSTLFANSAIFVSVTGAVWFYSVLVCPNHADGMANIVNPS